MPKSVEDVFGDDGDDGDDAPERTNPEPPDWAPAYLVKAVSNDTRTPDELRSLADYCQERAEYLAWLDDQPLDPSAELEESENLVAVQDTDVLPDGVDDSGGRGKVYWYKKDCGDDSCTTCPHGPYPHLKWRDGPKVHTKYLRASERPDSIPASVQEQRADADDADDAQEADDADDAQEADDADDADLQCNNCGKGLRWGDEYQLEEGTDHDAVCSDCRKSTEVAV